MNQQPDFSKARVFCLLANKGWVSRLHSGHFQKSGELHFNPTHISWLTEAEMRSIFDQCKDEGVEVVNHQLVPIS